jgi:hypothetical protein
LLAYRKRIGDTGITWTWRALTQHFLEYKKPKLKETCRKQYEHYLTLKEFAAINDNLVRDIKLRDLERVRDEILLNHAPSAVHRALTQSKSMLSWAWKFHATAAGLDDVPSECWSRCPGAGSSGVIDKNIDSSEGGMNGVVCRLDVIRVGDITSIRPYVLMPLAVQNLRGCVQSFLTTRQQRN